MELKQLRRNGGRGKMEGAGGLEVQYKLRFRIKRNGMARAHLQKQWKKSHPSTIDTARLTDLATDLTDLQN